MTAHRDFPALNRINRLSEAAAELGFEVVDIDGFLMVVETQAQAQRKTVADLRHSAENIIQATDKLRKTAGVLTSSAERTFADVQNSAEKVREMDTRTRVVAAWVQDLENRTSDVGETLRAVKKNNSQIASIAMQVNTLAINAKIEAARAGDTGKGFAVVAEAINELSQQTKAAAQHISGNIETLTGWIAELGKEAIDISHTAKGVLSDSTETEEALGRMETAVDHTRNEAMRIATESENAQAAIVHFGPHLTELDRTVSTTADGIERAHARTRKLIDTSEELVQLSAALGGTSADAPFIEYVQKMAHQLSTSLEEALDAGRVTLSELFDRKYTAIRGTDPEQKMAAYTTLFDEILPSIQEPALDFDKRVVFCAAVDQNGYLPTHNKKFAQPQGDDPVWNMAHCRNRRMFDDRVGLKAGNNTDTFLLQVYRRDMGGGEFVMMKDLSAPIMVRDRHWGGLRLAYTF